MLGNQKVPAQKKVSVLSGNIPVQNLAQGKSVSHKVLSSQYPAQYPVQKGSILEEIKGCQRELAAMMRGSNMGILPYWLIILWVTWGLPAQ
jgi:hypothetical protein